MYDTSQSFAAKLGELIEQIYPEVDRDILATQIIDAFWPEGAARRRRARTPGNRLWSERDALVIAYGNSIVDGVHKPLDLLRDFLVTELKGTINGVHVLPFFPYTSDDGFSVTDYRAVNPTLRAGHIKPDSARKFLLIWTWCSNTCPPRSACSNAYGRHMRLTTVSFQRSFAEDDLSMVVRPRTTPAARKVRPPGPAGMYGALSATTRWNQSISPTRRSFWNSCASMRLHIERGVPPSCASMPWLLWKTPGTASNPPAADPCHRPADAALVRLLRGAGDPPHGNQRAPMPRTSVTSANRNEPHAVLQLSLPPLLLQANALGHRALPQPLAGWQSASAARLRPT